MSTQGVGQLIIQAGKLFHVKHYLRLQLVSSKYCSTWNNISPCLLIPLPCFPAKKGCLYRYFTSHFLVNVPRGTFVINSLFSDNLKDNKKGLFLGIKI